MNQYMDFINQIPSEVLQKTERHLSSNIALFKPLIYMGGVKLNVTDYHIVIPSDYIPDTFFNNKFICAGQRKIFAINPGDNVSCLKTIQTKPYYSFLIKSDLLLKIAEEMDFSGEIRFKSILNPYPLAISGFFSLVTSISEYSSSNQIDTESNPALLISLNRSSIGMSNPNHE